MRSAPILLTTTWILVVACGSSVQQRQHFMGAVRGYNDGLRWRRHTHASAFIPPAERDEFMNEREELSDDLRIDDYELSRVRLGKRGNRAKVQVKYTWHQDSVGTVHKTTTEQKWERHGKSWQLVEELRLRGEEMPGVAEPPEETEPPAEELPGEEPEEAEPAGEAESEAAGAGQAP